MNSLQNVLITGCAGFIGMHLCKSLLDDGYNVLGIDNLKYSYRSNVPNKKNSFK